MLITECPWPGFSPQGPSRSYASGSLGLSPTRGRRNWLSNVFPQPLAVPPPLCQAPPTKSQLCKPQEQETGETEQWCLFPSNPKASKVAQYQAVLHRLGGFFFATHDMDFPSSVWRAELPQSQRVEAGEQETTGNLCCWGFQLSRGWENHLAAIPT